jgi:hypothetical protein
MKSDSHDGGSWLPFNHRRSWVPKENKKHGQERKIKNQTRIVNKITFYF